MYSKKDIADSEVLGIPFFSKKISTINIENSRLAINQGDKNEKSSLTIEDYKSIREAGDLVKTDFNVDYSFLIKTMVSVIDKYPQKRNKIMEQLMITDDEEKSSFVKIMKTITRKECLFPFVDSFLTHIIKNGMFKEIIEELPSVLHHLPAAQLTGYHYLMKKMALPHALDEEKSYISQSTRVNPNLT